MRFLFIKLRHIGDALLLTPTIAATKAKFPDAEVWVVVRKSCEGILRGCPEIDRILATAQPESERRSFSGLLPDLAMAALLVRTRFDYAFELGDNDRGRWLTLLSGAKNRCTNLHRSLHPVWKLVFNRITTKKRWPMHQVDRDYVCPADVLELPEPPPPLRFDPSRTEAWDAMPEEPFAVIHFATRWPSKAWPVARWHELIQGLLEFTPRLVMSCGPEPADVGIADELCRRAGRRVMSTRGRTSWAQLAGILRKADYFVGVDTAAMHLAAAVQCPVVCLFGPSADFEFHPWSVRYWMIRPQDSADPATVEQTPKDELMTLIPVDPVLAACREASAFGKNRHQDE